jgi:hypothetical protein
MSQDETKIANHDEAADEVEGHVKRVGANDDGTAEGDDEVEAHVKRAGHARKQ